MNKTKDIYKLTKHIKIEIYDTEKNKLYEVHTANARNYRDSEIQISINKKTCNVSKEFLDLLYDISNTRDFSLDM